MGVVHDQLVGLQFKGGLDTGSDQKTIPFAKLTRAENVVFKPSGALAKRRGYERLADDLGASGGVSGAIAEVKAIATRGDELVAFDGGKVYSYISSREYWVDRGPCVSVQYEQRTIAKARAAQTLADRATANGITVYAWEDARGGVYYTVMDETGAVLRGDIQLSSAATQPRCIAVNGFIHILFCNIGAGKLQTVRIASAEPMKVNAAQDLATDLRTASTPVYDVCLAGNRALFVYSTSAGGGSYKLAYMAASGSVSGSVTSRATSAVSIGISTTYEAQVMVIAGRAAAACELALFTSDLTIIDVGTGGPSDAARVTVTGLAGYFHDGVDPVIGYIFAEESTAIAAANDRIVHSCKVYFDAGLSTAVQIRHSVLCSRAFFVGTAAYVHIGYDTTLQATYFLWRMDGVIVGRFLPGIAGGIPAKAQLPQVESLGDGAYAWAGIYKTRLDLSRLNVTSAEPTYTEKGVKEITLDFDSDLAFRAVEKDQTLYVAGGMLMQFDGRSVVESGFLEFTEGVTITGNTGAGSSLNAGEIYYYLVFPEWVNEMGKVERGSCAKAFSVTINANGNKAVLTIPTIAHTMKTGTVTAAASRSAIGFAVYRTEKNPTNGSAFYRVSSLDPTAGGDNGWVANSQAANTVSFTDAMVDATLITKERAYTTFAAGTELDNIAPESGAILAEVGDRLWTAGGAEDGNRAYYSKLPKFGECVAWSDPLQVNVGEEGGRITGIANLDGAVVIFKRDRIYLVTGDGSDNLGQSDFAPARLVSTDVGCVDHRSVVETPAGLMFKSTKGLYLLGRSLQAIKIGKDVEGYDAQDVTAATMLADVNEVRCLTSEGATLVYNYYTGGWTTFTIAGASAAMWRGVYTYVRTDGRVMVESDSYSDGGANYRRVVETAFLHLAPFFQGRQRLRAFYLLLNYKSTHRLQWSIQYDDEGTFRPPAQFDPATALNLTTWGSDALYGDSSPWGGGGESLYQIEGIPQRQKCQAFRLRFEDAGSDPTGEAFEIVELVLRMGVKQAGPMMRSGQRSGIGVNTQP